MTRLREAKKRQDEEIARVQEFIDRFRYKATKAAQVQSRIKMLEKVERIEVPPERKRIHFQFPAGAEERPDGARAEGRAQGVRAEGRARPRGPAHRARRSHRARRPQRRRQVDADAPAVGRRGARSRRAREGHQVVTQYFAQDEATRLDPALTVYETLSSGSPDAMIPAIRNILGGFLFSGDDVYKKVAVLSGGERTRLAVARMLLRPSNTLLLDEPTNHLDLDSKEVLLDALADYGGTLVFVSHDRYFVERLATRIVEVGDGKATLYPGTYTEYLWSKENAAAAELRARTGSAGLRSCDVAAVTGRPAAPHLRTAAPCSRDAPRTTMRRRSARPPSGESATRRCKALRDASAELEARIAERDGSIKELEAVDGRARLLRRSTTGQAGHRPASGADVGSRRPAQPVGDAAGRGRGVRGSQNRNAALRFCNCRCADRQ